MEHVNSGLSDICRHNSEIIIYRKEEWFKVFIHETIHAFNLHFSLEMNEFINLKLNSFYNLNIDYCAFESYCEFWALLWNSMFHAYIKTKSYDAFFNKLNFIYNIECEFTDNQCKKISNHIGFNDSFYKNKYKENTPVFSYFFLKRCLLLNINNFINFCNDNNNSIINFKTNNDNIISFINFLIQNNKTNLIILHNDNNCRMTIFDFE